MSIQLHCPRCNNLLIASTANTASILTCPRCRTQMKFQPVSQPVVPAASNVQPMQSINQIEPTATDASGEWKYWLGFTVLLTTLIVGMVILFSRRLRDSADRNVAEKVHAAQKALDEKKWNDAIELLERATATKKATDLQEAERLLKEARRRKADEMLVSAKKAIENGDTQRALRLLTEYQANPDATQKPEVAKLAKDIMLVTDEKNLINLLISLSEDDFTLVTKGLVDPLLPGDTFISLMPILEKQLALVLPKMASLREEDSRRRANEAGKELRRYHAGEGFINTCAFSNDSRFVAASFHQYVAKVIDGVYSAGVASVLVWDRESGNEIHRFQPPAKRTNAPPFRGRNGGDFPHFTGVAFSHDNRMIGASRQDGVIYIWDVATGMEKFALHEPTKDLEEEATCLAFSSDGKWLVAGCNSQPHLNRLGRTNFHVRVWDLSKDSKFRNLDGHSGPVTSVAFSADSQFIISGGADRIAILWDVNTGKEIRPFDAHENAVRCVAITPDGSMVLSGGDDRRLIFWSTETGAHVHTLETPYLGTITSIHVLRSGKYALVKLGDIGQYVRHETASHVLIDIINKTMLKSYPAFSWASDRVALYVSQGNIQATYYSLPHCAVLSSDARWVLHDERRTERIRGKNLQEAYLVLRGSGLQ